jgi:hypothetical protein
MIPADIPRLKSTYVLKANAFAVAASRSLAAVSPTS